MKICSNHLIEHSNKTKPKEKKIDQNVENPISTKLKVSKQSIPRITTSKKKTKLLCQQSEQEIKINGNNGR